MIKKPHFNGTTYDEIKENISKYLDNPPMIALPGGTWCYFCNVELCRTGKHNKQMYAIVINKLINDLANERSR